MPQTDAWGLPDSYAQFLHRADRALWFLRMVNCNVLFFNLLMHSMNGTPSPRQIPVYILMLLVNKYPCILGTAGPTGRNHGN